MIRTKVAGAALGTMLVLGGTASAASATDDDAPADNPLTEDTNADDDGGFDDWGLLGLLGLLGLGGLAKKRQDTTVTTRRTTGTTGTTGTGSTAR